MSPIVHAHLLDISRVADKIQEHRGVRIGYMPITPKFAGMLDAEGFVPGFDHVKGFGLCWVWMIWDNLRIISTIG